MKALIGHSGFVGTTLKAQTDFDALYRSTDIGGVEGRTFDTVVCAGAPAQKWIAEREPEADLAGIQKLAGHLDRTSAEVFILISTVDVFADSRGADEASVPDEIDLGAYGRNRLWLERFVVGRFKRALVVRLPGLVGPGLRKNAVFDLLNHNNLHMIDHRAVFQFYPMASLWWDIRRALAADLSLVHLTAAPLSMGEVAREGFGVEFANVVEGRTPAAYDLRSRHAELLGGSGPYTCSARESLTAIRAYAQSEPRSKPPAA